MNFRQPDMCRDGPTFNPFPASGLKRSPRERVLAFAAVLQDAGIVTTVRKTRGEDIDAAGGQLAGEVLDRPQANERLARRRAVMPIVPAPLVPPASMPVPTAGAPAPRYPRSVA